MIAVHAAWDEIGIACDSVEWDFPSDQSPFYICPEPGCETAQPGPHTRHCKHHSGGITDGRTA